MFYKICLIKENLPSPKDKEINGVFTFPESEWEWRNRNQTCVYLSNEVWEWELKMQGPHKNEIHQWDFDPEREVGNKNHIFLNIQIIPYKFSIFLKYPPTNGKI